MIAFEKLPSETFDLVLARCETIRERAALDNQFVTSSQSCALQLLRICDIQAQHLASLLQPFSGQLPQNDAQLKQMCAQLRRCSTVEENATGNSGAALHEPPLQTLAEAHRSSCEMQNCQSAISCAADATTGIWNDSPWGSRPTEPWIPGEHRMAFSVEADRRGKNRRLICMSFHLQWE